MKGIDLQHRQLINVLNQLWQSILLGRDEKTLANAMGFLEEYSVFHFRTEERFFTRHGYPRAEQHKQQHQWFVDRVRSYRRHLEGGGAGLGLNVVSFLAGWTRRHIAGTDRDYGEWMKRTGVLEELRRRHHL